MQKMACQGCQRRLLLLARQVEVSKSITTELCSAPLGQQLLRRVATTATRRLSEQRRGFRSTPRQSNFLKNARDAIQRVVQRSNEPYRVVGASKEIYTICSKEAPYNIDPIAVKAGTVPMTPEGEHIGKGKGMWHDGKRAMQLFPSRNLGLAGLAAWGWLIIATSIQISSFRPPSAHGLK